MPWESWANLWPVIAGTIGGIGAIAIAAFTKFGERVADYLVSRQVESFKHGLETQIEALRARLAHVGDRGVRSNELEYKATIAAWESIVEAYLATYGCIVGQSNHPDFTHMSDADAEEYLKTTGFSETQQEQVMGEVAAKRHRMCRRITELRYINRAGNAIFDARLVLRKQGIFIPKTLEDEFDAALKLYSAAQIQRHMELNSGSSGTALGLPNDVGGFAKKAPPEFDRIKALVRERILQTV